MSFLFSDMGPYHFSLLRVKYSFDSAKTLAFDHITAELMVFLSATAPLASVLCSVANFHTELRWGTLHVYYLSLHELLPWV